METAAWRTRHNPIVNADSARSLPPSSSWFSIPRFSVSILFACLLLSSQPSFLSFLTEFVSSSATYYYYSVVLFFFSFLGFSNLWLTALMHLHRDAPTEFNPRGELFLFREDLRAHRASFVRTRRTTGSICIAKWHKIKKKQNARIRIMKN